MKLVMPKKAFSMTLAFVMAASAFTGFHKPMTVNAAGSKTVTGLGTGSIANPVKGGGQWNYVYYGKYNDKSVKYRVLDVDSSDYGKKETMLLDCDNVLFSLNVDSTSELTQKICNDDFYNKKGVFTVAEKDAIAFSKKETKSNTDGIGVDGSFEQLTDEKIFALDPSEAANRNYGYNSSNRADSKRIKKTLDGNDIKPWWLRLEYKKKRFDIINQTLYRATTIGTIDYTSISDVMWVSPAFNVERSSILFSSLVSTNTYKLTLMDQTMNIPYDIRSKVKGDSAEISFKYLHTDDDKDLSFSVILLNKQFEKGMTVRDSSEFAYIPVNITSNTQSGNGKSINNTARGTIKLPNGYTKFKYAYLISEKTGSSTETDYACAPQFFDLNTDEHVHEWEIAYLGAGDDNATIRCTNCGKSYTVSILASSKEYGEKPSAKVNKPKDLPSDIEVSDVIYRDRSGRELDESEVTEVGEYTAVAVIAAKNKNGKDQVEEIANNFKITPIVLLPSMIKLSEERYVYDGTPKTPDVTVTVKGKVLSKDEYDVEYKNNVEIGVATVVVTSLNPHYTDKATNSFRIVDQSVADKEDKAKEKIEEKNKKEDGENKEDSDLLDKIEDKYKDATKNEGNTSGTKNKDNKQVVQVNSAIRHYEGDVLVSLGDTYVVTSADDTDLKVRFEKARSETISSVTIPSSIVVDGNEYRVTEIANGAFSGNKKLKKVKIGENVEKIGEDAFYKCKKLKKITIETTYLKKSNVGKHAFKKIHKEAKVIVPENRLNSYTKLLKSRGISGKSQVITK